jgi:hypothetical protein
MSSSLSSFSSFFFPSALAASAAALPVVAAQPAEVDCRTSSGSNCRIAAAPIITYVKFDIKLQKMYSTGDEVQRRT